MSGANCLRVRVDRETAAFSFHDLEDYVVESVQDKFLDPRNKAGWATSIEVELQARDFWRLRDFHAKRLRALNEALESCSEEFDYNHATVHEQLIVEVLNRLGEAREVGLPLSDDQIYEARRNAAESPRIARLLRDMLDEELELHADCEAESVSAADPERDLLAGIAGVGRQVDRRKKEREDETAANTHMA